MKSAKVNFNSHQAMFLTLAATLQGPTAGREREREKVAEQHGVRAGQLGFFAQRSGFSYIFGFHQLIKLLPKAEKQSVAKNSVLEKLLIRFRCRKHHRTTPMKL